MSEGPPVRRDRLPLVTIGVPVFNGARYLAGALTSAVEQEYGNLEIVVADNASTDGTDEICREFARKHDRVRWFRSRENLGLMPNYRKVLEAARGKYFTWLSADDLLSSPGYVARCVAVLERAPDVVLCATGMHALDYDWPGSVSTAILHGLDEGRDWRESRHEFFRVPYRDERYFAFYGLYRREALARVPLEAVRYRGTPIVLEMEYPILAALSLAGRIVALPDALRSYRCRDDSVGSQLVTGLPATTKTLVSVAVKLRVLRIALASGLPRRERARATAVALANFFGTTSRVHTIKQEARMLRRVCEERLDLIRRLDAAAAERLRLIEALQETVQAQARRIGELERGGAGPSPGAAPSVEKRCRLARWLRRSSRFLPRRAS
jgi:glycosyltransferase involved in cell wall biosynthesis